MGLDLKIVGGDVVDGTGLARRRADVGVKDGVIVAVGQIEEQADVELDATGLVVAPGFIDIHTHLDAQVMWDPMLSVSSWHGVTTVVMGNCGFGFAPTRREDRELVMRTLENVEGMDFECLRAGLGAEWGFETFPEYLEALQRAHPALNVAALVPHSPLRVWVMGEDASRRAATGAEVAQMADLLAEALHAGAVGFSTSMHPGHIGAGGLPVPSRLAELSEIIALARVASERGGLFMAGIGPNLSIGELEQIHAATGVTITFTGLTAGMGGRADGHRRLLARSEAAHARGVPITPQVSCLPVTSEFDIADPMPLTHTAPAALRAHTLEAEFADVYAANTPEGRIAAYSSRGFAQRFRDATDSERWHRIWDGMRIASMPGRPDLEQTHLTAYASAEGVHPAEALLQLAIASNLKARFSLELLNNDEDEVALLLTHPVTQVALSDAGAHVSQLCDACFATRLLGHWARDTSVLTLEQAVRMLTKDPATLFGFADRGVLAEGYGADVVVFDPDTVGNGQRRLVRDLPAGARRITVDAEGIDTVIVNGRIIRRRGSDVANDVAPGVLLRARPRTSVS